MRKVRRFKEKYVSLAFPSLSQNLKTRALSDAEISRLSSAEVLFYPSLFEMIIHNVDEENFAVDSRISTLMETPPVVQSIVNSINKCSLDYRRQLWGNIYLTGGTSQLPNIKERIYNDLQPLSPSGVKVEIRHCDDTVYSSVLGALYSLNYHIGDEWLSVDDFQDNPDLLVERFSLLENAFLETSYSNS